MTLYALVGFNNYYNRKCIRYETVTDYLTNCTSYMSIPSVNWNESDGVSTSHVFQVPSTSTFEVPDYLIVLDSTNNVVQRWFVLEAKFNAGNQYILTLYRDLVAEELNKLITAPCFIEKATLTSGPFLYNKENMSYNQIKKSEVLLKDSTQTSWIVGYLNKGVTPDNPITDSYTTTPDITVNNIDDWEYADYLTDGFVCYPKQKNWKFRIEENGSFNYVIYSVYSGQPTLNNYERSVHGSDIAYAVKEGATPQYMNRDLALQSLYNKAVVWDNQVTSVAPIFHSQSDTTEFLNIINKTIKDNNTGKLYKISLTKIQDASSSGLSLLSSSLIVDNFLPWVDESDYFQRNSRTPNNSGVEWNFIGDQYTIKLTELKAELNINWTSSHNVCPEEIFDLFCMPANQLYVKTGVNTGFYVDGEVSLKSYAAIDRALTSGQLLDIQLVPYCPILESYPEPERIITGSLITGLNKAMTLDVSGKTNHKDYDFITDDNDNPLGIIFWAQSARFSGSYTNSHRDLETGHIVNYIDYDLSTPQNIKVTNECDSYRLCSPNYNGQFELNIAKNGGFLGFNIHCAYKPFTPYIQIEPVFGGLYGQSFTDARGLICGGDFSLPQKDSKWAEYQLNNKNYQVMFDRQIQNMTDMNEIALKEARWQTGVGAVTGAMSGATVGAMTGLGSIATGIGAVAGFGASLAGGLADIDILKQRQALTLDYTKDMFGYNLENIQALPYSITKVGAFVPTNKIFPFIEYYTCSDEEKAALIEKIQWNGMTVGVIGTIEQFKLNTPTYIKGRLIRLDNIAEDYHYLISLAEEITKGVYI